jgi:hypothetical protein
VDVGAQSARAGIPEHIQEALARSGTTRRAAARPPSGGDDHTEGPYDPTELLAVGGAGTAP